MSKYQVSAVHGLGGEVAGRPDGGLRRHHEGRLVRREGHRGVRSLHPRRAALQGVPPQLSAHIQGACTIATPPKSGALTLFPPWFAGAVQPRDGEPLGVQGAAGGGAAHAPQDDALPRSRNHLRARRDLQQRRGSARVLRAGGNNFDATYRELRYIPHPQVCM